MAKKSKGSRNLFRRHEEDCPHRSDGRKYDKCLCPIWLDFRDADKRIRTTLGVHNWQMAEDFLRKWDANAEKG
jgi:hypothetical protein